MVHHEIDDQVEIPADILHILPCAEGGIHFVIGERGKPPVGRGRVKGENVNPADGVAQIPAQHVMQFEQVIA